MHGPTSQDLAEVTNQSELLSPKEAEGSLAPLLAEGSRQAQSVLSSWDVERKH